ncbi:acetyltransferase [Streptomyces carpaticus]|nr:acetyltransferase [Streptomyces carpaticus]
MQGQSAHPAAGPGRTGGTGGRPVRLRHGPQPPHHLLGGAVSIREPGCEDTLELELPRPAAYPAPVGAVGAWGPAATAGGRFRLLPVEPRRDLALLAGWMNDPVVDRWWSLAGTQERTAAHLGAQLAGDGRSVPCLGLLDGRPMSYWEVYRADLDPLARYYSAAPHDIGLHLLIGTARDRGRGLGAELLRAVSALVLRHHPRCARIVAEPDVRNAASVAAFRAAGFRKAAEAELPDKRAAIMLRDR